MVKKSILWTFKAAFYLLATAILLIAAAAAALQFYFLPNIDQYKNQIDNQLTAQLGQQVNIGDIRSDWDGINPSLYVRKIEIFDAQNRVALTLNDVETSLSWWSIPLLEPRLAKLTLHKPELTIRREADGTVYVAGISMSGPSKPEFANWLLKQAHIEIDEASVTWLDDMRKAPPLSLTHVKLSIASPTWKALVGQHQVALHATPSVGSKWPIELRATVYGKDVSAIQDWHGSLYSYLQDTDLSVWKPWVDYPIALESGDGASRVWLDFEDKKIKSLTADIELNNLKAAFSAQSKPAHFKRLSSRIKWKAFSQGQELEASAIHMTSMQGISVDNGHLKLAEKTVNHQQQLSGELKLDTLDLSTVQELASYLPLPANALQTLSALNPQGKLKHLTLDWQGSQQALTQYNLRSQFSGLGITATDHIPGFTNFTGEIELDEKSGLIVVDAQQATMDFKKVLRWPLPAEKLTGQIKWKKSKDVVDIHVDNLAINSVHIGGVINADYQHRTDGNDSIDLSAKFDRANGQHAVFYFPTVLSKDTLHWLDTSILNGTGENVQVTLKGRIKEFPWADNKKGLFQVKAKIKDGVLDYGTGWPKLEGVGLDLLFQGKRMELNAHQGHFWGNKLINAKVTIEDLDALHPVLNVNGNFEGPITDTIRFINNSPILAVTEGFTDGLRTAGKGKLKLDLKIPLDNVDASKTKGTYTIMNGTMVSGAIPELTKVNGSIDFTETGLSAKNISAWAFGGPALVNISTGAHHLVKVSANGTVTDYGLKQAYNNDLLDKLKGKADWQADISVKQEEVDIAVRSNLAGMAIDLPKPVGKAANETLPLKVVKSQSSSKQDLVNINYGNLIAAKFLRVEKLGKLEVERGEIAINGMPQLPNQSGIFVKGNLKQLDADDWLTALADANTTATNSASLPPIKQVDMAIDTLRVFDRDLHQLKLAAKPTEGGWTLNANGNELLGNAQWLSKGNGKIVARLKTLKIPSGNTDKNAPTNSSNSTQRYPELDIVVDEFEVGAKKLGAMELIASESNNSWRIQKLTLTTPHSKLIADGVWNHWKTNPSTQMNIAWSASNLGEALDSLNYPGTIKNGNAEITGSLKWPGSPHEFGYAGLSGSFKLNAKSGQILKIQPGVGRLFSVLSLQNLPRRLTFDFRDVFSEGFAYDDISADVTVEQGILHSNNFKMKGATALVEMKGKTDLSKETQHLFVKVTPYISDTVSLAALAGGPAVAAAAYVAQKILNDPLNKLARDRYEFVGTWDNPIEVKAETPAKEEKPAQIPGQ